MLKTSKILAKLRSGDVNPLSRESRMRTLINIEDLFRTSALFLKLGDVSL